MGNVERIASKTKQEAKHRIQLAMEDLEVALKRLDKAQQSISRVTMVSESYTAIGTVARVCVEDVIRELRSAMYDGEADLDSEAKELFLKG